MRKAILYLIIVFLLSIVLFSCKKENGIDCRGNCKQIKVKGRVFDATTNAGLSNISISVSWYFPSSSGCYFCVLNQSATSNSVTNAGGYFEVPITIDPTLNNYEISISASQAVGYYAYSPSWANPQKPESYQNVEIKCLPKATLKLNFHRNQTDSFQLFYAGLSIKNNNPGADSLLSFNNFFSRNMQQPLSDTSVTIITVANLYTKISKNKKRSNSIINTTYDSVICIPNYSNEITINY